MNPEQKTESQSLINIHDEAQRVEGALDEIMRHNQAQSPETVLDATKSMGVVLGMLSITRKSIRDIITHAFILNRDNTVLRQRVEQLEDLHALDKKTIHDHANKLQGHIVLFTEIAEILEDVVIAKHPTLKERIDRARGEL